MNVCGCGGCEYCRTYPWEAEEEDRQQRWEDEQAELDSTMHTAFLTPSELQEWVQSVTA